MKINYPIVSLVFCCLVFSNTSLVHAQQYSQEECDENGQFCHIDSQIIVQFDVSALYMPNVNNPGIASGPLPLFLGQDALDALSAAAGFDMSSVVAYKFDPQLSAEETTMVDNTGETVAIDPLWSIFLLELPLGTHEQQTCYQLRPLFPLVQFAHLNWTNRLSGGANDASYLSAQASLHATTAVPNASINVQGAWDRTIGRSGIKVGIADGGVRQDHADLQINGASVVIDGYDAISQTSPGNSLTDPVSTALPNGHGTPIAGIIGAVRNNTIGVAGIAGGDALTNTQGVSLYSLRCAGTGGGIWSTALAIEKGATTTSAGFGLQLINVSLNDPVNPPLRLWNDFNVGMLALRLAHRNKVTVVASAGNDQLYTSPSVGEDLTFPAHARDAWTLTVGGTDENGNSYQEIPQLGGAISAAHPFVDIAAPANKARTTNAAYNTIYSLSSISQTSYSIFSRTSAAAAHASGVAALMMSYHNNPALPAENLQPEDVENLLKLHAKDITVSPASAGQDDYTGAGLIDATSVIEGLRTNRLYHSPAASADPAVIDMQPVGVAQDYYMEGSGIQPGLYNAQAYRVRIYAHGDYDPYYAAAKRWGLNASSSFFGPPMPFTGARFAGSVPTPSQTVTLEPWVNVVGPAGKTSMMLEGYAYRLNSSRLLGPPASYGQPYQISTVSNAIPPSMQWQPFDPTSTPGVGEVRSMRYASYGVYIGPVGLRNAGSENGGASGMKARTVAYPNPATNQVTLAFATPADGAETAEVQLTTIDGRLIRNEKQAVSRPDIGTGTVEVSLAGLPVGLYLYRITTDANVQQGRLTKSE